MGVDKEDKRAKWMKKKARKDNPLPPNKVHAARHKKRPKHKKDLYQ